MRRWFSPRAAQACAEERIERFISDVDVQRNGDLIVTETIQIRAEGQQIKRGILRDFPTSYRRADGSRVEVGFDIQFVTLDGSHENYVTERMANGVRVRIGSAGRTINTGSHLYVIQYRTTRQIGFFEGYDELYWNATGTGWTFPIDMAEARIHLPDKVADQAERDLHRAAGRARPRRHRRPAAAGPHRLSHDQAAAGRERPHRRGGLAQGRGAASPRGCRRLRRCCKDDPALLAAGIGGGLVIGFYLLAWFLVGRDPRSGTIIPLFGPPKGMSAAGVGFVHDMGFDERVFAAAIVGLGVNGRLKLVDRGEQAGAAASDERQAVGRGRAGNRDGRCSPRAARSSSTTPIMRPSPARAASFTRRCSSPTAGCSATISGFRAWACLARSLATCGDHASPMPISYGANAQGICHRHFHPAHADHDRRGGDSRPAGARRRPWPACAC